MTDEDTARYFAELKAKKLSLVFGDSFREEIERQRRALGLPTQTSDEEDEVVIHVDKRGVRSLRIDGYDVEFERDGTARVPRSVGKKAANRYPEIEIVEGVEKESNRVPLYGDFPLNGTWDVDDDE